MLARRCSRRQLNLSVPFRYTTGSIQRRPPIWLLPTSYTSPAGVTRAVVGELSAARRIHTAQPSGSSAPTSTSSPNPSASKISERSGVASDRRYSTAADVSPQEYHSGEFPFYGDAAHKPKVPLPGSAQHDGAGHVPRPGAELNWVQLHDPSSYLFLNTPELPMQARPIETSRNTIDPFRMGTGSQREDVISSFIACTQVKSLDRAEVLLKRLSMNFIQCISIQQDQETEKLEMTSLHNMFLRAHLEQALDSLSKEAADADSSSPEATSNVGTQKDKFSLHEFSLAKLEEWYWQTMVASQKLDGDSWTIATLIEAAMHRPRDPESRRQEIVSLIVKWGNMKMGKFGDVLKHLSQQAIAEVQSAYKLQHFDLHEEQMYILEGVQRPELPEVMATPVKGFGLEAVKQSLRSFADHRIKKYEPIFESEEQREQFAINRQKALEEDAYTAAIRRWRAESEALDAVGIQANNPAINPLMHQWLTAMVPLIEQELLHVKEAEANPTGLENFERCQYGPFLRLLPPEKLAGITITNIVRLSTISNTDNTALKASSAVISIGKAVEHEYVSEQLKKCFETKPGDADFYQKRALQKQLTDARNARDLSMLIYRQNRRAEMDQDGSGLISNEKWSQPIRAKVGSVLASLLFQCAKVKVNPMNPKARVKQTDTAIEQPALYHTYQFVGGKKVGVIRLHDTFGSKLVSEPLKGTTLAKQLPMVARPRPWCAWNDGAYYFTPSRMIRIKDSLEQLLYIKEASRQGSLDKLFAGLDVLGSTAWRINQKVFDVVLQVWNTGERFADIPAILTKDVQLPEEPAPDADASTKAAYKELFQEVGNMRKNNHSQRCDVNFKMEIARAFYNEEFYFPHNLDFRGRAYPLPPHLNHIGNDLCRGLLKFSERKPLGVAGLRWLKIHLANLCGFDKASLTAREDYTTQHLEDILDSARRPLDGNRWWLKAEDPWQCLATCMELEEALSLPDPTEYMSNMPVHQDGTCNGLQHYAALGGDMAGARQVNLEPSEKPQDVYTGVADLVNEAVAKDAERGVPEAQELLGHINRKVVKQTVMTNVYGVTFIGAKAQVKNRLVEKAIFPRDRVEALAMYLTKKIFASLKSMFTGAHLIQTWFGECARRISRSIGPSQWEKFDQHFDGSIPETGRKTHTKERGKVEFMSSVVWTTPLGLPVVQPYRHEATVAVHTNLQQITIVDTSIINQVDSRKQMAAFPPNFVHSLDATHMLLSALATKQAGLTFAAVHDSFWTHACDVDTMSRVLRDAFVTMHTEDIVEKLREEFNERYRQHKTLISIPENHPVGLKIMRHRLDLEAKMRAKAQKQAEKDAIAKKKKVTTKTPTRPKKIMMTAIDDLMRELERDRLLNADNNKDIAKGKAMVTAASIFEEGGLTIDQDFGVVESEGFGDSLRSAGQANLDLEGGTKIQTSGELDEGAPQPQEAAPKKFKKAPRVVYVWVDLKFPPVPPKGEFDVKRLKDSQYFFS